MPGSRSGFNKYGTETLVFICYPAHLGVGVLDSEEDIAGGEDGALGHGLDPERQAATVLTQDVLPTCVPGFSSQVQCEGP